MTSEASEGAAKPALLWMHGCPLILENRKGIMRPFHTGLLEQDYAIVSIGYLLAPETKLAAIVEDVPDAWKWMHEQSRRFGIEPSRIAASGASADGHAKRRPSRGLQVCARRANFLRLRIPNLHLLF